MTSFRLLVPIGCGTFAIRWMRIAMDRQLFDFDV